MKRALMVFPLLFLALILGFSTASAAPGEPTSPAPVLCLPGIYLSSPMDCSPGGPSAYLTGLAEKGMTLPLSPLPARSPDPSLITLDVRYGEVRTANAPVYASVDEALKGKKGQASRFITGAFTYISYLEDTVVDGKRFYEIEPGSWMTANDISRIGAVPRFQGLEFTRTPERDFGWVLGYMSDITTESRRTPGFQSNDFTGRVYQTYDVVQIYAVETVDNVNWYLIGPDEWLPDQVVAHLTLNSTPPQGISGERWIEVNLAEQVLSVYDQKQLVFATLVATGSEPFWTQPGVFQIKQKLDTTYMRGSFEADLSDAYYLEDVPYTMYYDGARALHGAYWRAKLGFPQSHGCVNLTVGDSHWLFDWASEGDWVYVWDPSGKTPTDPKLYSSGGY